MAIFLFVALSCGCISEFCKLVKLLPKGDPNESALKAIGFGLTVWLTVWFGWFSGLAF